MEERLTEWLLENRPYTCLNMRLKHFILFCRSLQPGLSYSTLRNTIAPIVDRLMLGEVGRLWNRDRCYERVLRMYGANDQRTDAWHLKRNEMITASEVYGVFGSDSARRDIILRKLETRPHKDGPPITALLWGTRFEPIAKRIYEERTKCQITDVSCVQHPVYKFLGASPDGLIACEDMQRYGRLVEFKCPISRAPKDEIPPGYIHQMQMQMECTGIDECEYVEFRFRQVNYNEWVHSQDTKGFFVVYDDGRVVYDKEADSEECQIVYWILGSIKQDLVQKDPQWLSSHIVALTKVWNEVLEHRANGTTPELKQLPSLEL